MTSRRVAVIGAGAIGLACAMRLAEAGWRVDLHEGHAAGPNASQVAAGMLAPASEALLDSAGPYPMLVHARDLWADFAASLALPLSREGALHLLAPEPARARMIAAERLGARAVLLSPAGLARALPPGLVASQGAVGVSFADDWRLEAGAALRALAARVRNAGVRATAAADPTQALPRALGVDAVVIAAGWGAARFAGLAPEAASLSPVKGQLLRFVGAGPPHGPVVRGEGVYLVPDAAGAIVGATMEPGAADVAPDPARLADLRARAARLDPSLAHAAAQEGVGVRATTPDGLPLVGPSATPGVFWAAGARRNGWLLAPLVAEGVAAYLDGRDPGPWAPLLHPRRFDPSGQGGDAAP